MKLGLAIKPEERNSEKHGVLDIRGPRPDASGAFDLEVLICRIDQGETRARAANLPLKDSRAATVREAMQMVIQQARELITDCAARDRDIPCVEPPVQAAENESRFVVPLSL
jgi:hypothetical protein